MALTGHFPARPRAVGATRDHRRRAVAGIAIVALAGPLALAACSNGGSDNPDGSQSATTPAGSSAATTSARAATATSEPKAGGTLTVASGAIPPVIDPYATTLQGNWGTARNVCEPLFDTTADLAIEPMLVDSYTYDKDLTYVFTLRSGVKFHDGSTMTAADVVSNIARFVQTPGNGSLLGNNLASYEATGDLEVTLTLKTPSAIVPTLLTTMYIMPASVQDGRGIDDPANDLDCTGPYKLASYEPDREIKLVRNDDYSARTDASDGAVGKKVAYIDEIDFVPMPESSSQVQALQAGEIDLTSSLPLDLYDTVKSSENASAVLLSPVNGATVVFNKIQGVMSNVKMRQAFLAALDMTQVMGAGFGNPDFYELDGSIIPAMNKTWASSEGLENYNHPDLDKVKELLTEANYNGEKIVWMTTKSDPTWYLPTEPATQLLKEAGLNIDLQVLDQATVLDRRTDPTQYDLFSSGIPVYADPVLLPYLQDSFPGGWTNPDKNALLDKLNTAPTTEERQQVWGQLQQLIYTDVPFLKFGATRPLYGASNSFHFPNADQLQSNAGLYNTWLDPQD
jgi:peptide/nickel transport system substrate-binding protein